MTNQPFPNLQSKITGPHGEVTPVWRAFFQAMWDRTGGSIASVYALLNGNALQRFKVAPAFTTDEAVNLGQGNALYQPIGNYAAKAGDPLQAFDVGPAVLPTQAVELVQMTTALALKADLASPALTGTPTAPTAAPGANTTQLATTAFVAALGALKAPLASPAFTGTVGLPVYTVATLPAGAVGQQAYVTDATAVTFGAIPTGGGLLGTPVAHDGTNWRMG